MKVCEGARGLEGPIVIVDGELLPPRHGSPHLGGIRLGTDSSNLPSSSGESANFRFLPATCNSQNAG
jgi:hypothetical protein